MSSTSWTESGPYDGQSVREWERSVADRVRMDMLGEYGADAIPERHHLQWMVSTAIDAILGDPEDGQSGWYAEMTNDPRTWEPWVDGSPKWDPGQTCRAYWIAHSTEARTFYAATDEPEWSQEVAAAQLEMSCEVYEYTRDILGPPVLV